MTETGLELVLWLLLAFFLGAIAGCILRFSAAGRASDAGARRPSPSGDGLARVDSSGTSAVSTSARR